MLLPAIMAIVSFSAFMFRFELVKYLFTKSVCSGAFGEIMYALACYVLIAVSAGVILIDDHSACFGFYSQGVDCHLCSSW